MALSNLTGTPAQNKLIIKLLSEVKKDDEGFDVLEFNLREELNTNSIEKMYEFTKTLRAKEFKLEDEKDAYLYPLFGLMKISKETGMLQARLSEDVRPLLLGLKHQFTKFKKNEALQVSGTYAFKLFQMLKAVGMNGGIQEWEVTLKDFRWRMGIGDSEYGRMINFTNRVLKPAIKENTKFFKGLEVEKIKKGRLVHSLRFTWESEKRMNKSFEEPCVIDVPYQEAGSSSSGLSSELKALADKIYRFREKHDMLDMPTRDQRTEPFKLAFAQYAAKELLAKGMFPGLIFKFLTAKGNVRDVFNACCDSEAGGALVLKRIREYSSYFERIMSE